MAFRKITEEDSPHRHLETKSVAELLTLMNQDDQGVARSVKEALGSIVLLAEAIFDKMLAGGRLFYIGAGTSGRLGILDASECPPTFGVPAGLVIGIIAGGEQALTRAVEHAEDDSEQGWRDLLKHNVSNRDVVIGLTAGGNTPYVLGALKSCQEAGIITGSITCNPSAPVKEWSDFPVEAITGPEFVTGSTRLKAGTAQKLIINMISTAVMIKLGRVSDNKMVDLLLHNEKLRDRGARMVMEGAGLTDPEQARKWLLTEGSVRKAIAAALAQKKGSDSQKK